MAAFSVPGCGTLPAKPIQDVETITGTWNGNLSYQRAQYGTWTVGATWIIQEDGTYAIITPRWSARGTFKIDNGEVHFFSPWAEGFYSNGRRASGIARLYQNGGGKYLLSSGQPDVSGAWRPAE
ncbi:MAG: hypothetical protein ACE5JS_07185 [Nitrospinota bacterium]